METNYKLICENDLKHEKVKVKMDEIKEKNEKLYNYIMINLMSDGSLGIRDDILHYISEKIEGFRTEQEYVYNIASLICNVKVTIPYLEWINAYFNGNPKIHISEFTIILNEAIEKDIPLKEIKRIFSDENDAVVILGKIADYEPDNVPADNKEESSVILKNDELSKQVPSVKEGFPQKINKETSVMPEVFNSLLNAMTYRNSNEDDMIAIQNNINQIIAKFQLASTELTSYSNILIREWEKDREEIQRLKTLNKMLQSLLTENQKKMHDLRNENVRLIEKIQAAEQSERSKDMFGKKLMELQELLNETTSYKSYLPVNDLY